MGRPMSAALSQNAQRWQTATFGLLAATLATISWIAVHDALTDHTRRVLTFGVSFDLSVTLPGAYYLLVARPRHQATWVVGAVALIGVLRAAALIVPDPIARIVIGGVVEAAVLTFVVVRSGTAWQASGKTGDPLVRLARMGEAFATAPWVGEVLATELAVIYYAGLSWARAPHVPPGSRAFSVHRRSGATMMYAVMAGMCVLETAILHVVIQHWSVRTAWFITSMDLYGTLCLVAAARAIALRPILVDDATITLRQSLWWTVNIDRAVVRDVQPFSGPRPSRKSQDTLVLASFTTPSVRLSLTETVVAHGPWGRRKSVMTIVAAIDDAAGFIDLVRDVNNSGRQ